MTDHVYHSFHFIFRSLYPSVFYGASADEIHSLVVETGAVFRGTAQTAEHYVDKKKRTFKDDSLTRKAMH